MAGELIDVAVRLPKLAVDRPFTYRLPETLEAGVGSLVQVPFHGRSVQAWVLGDSPEEPERVSEVRKVLSPVRFFDQELLELYRSLAYRFLMPLSVAIDRGIPRRVVSEEAAEVVAAQRPPLEPEDRLPGRWSLRARPEEELPRLLGSVQRCLDSGRDAIVVVPEIDPVPELVDGLEDAFGEDVCLFAGGEPRERYRTWLDILGGRYRVVVGTRPAVFAPVPNPGLLWVNREIHAGHREPRSPSWHVRDVALMRGGIERASVVVSGMVPSAEALAARLSPAMEGRRAWPIVETVKPGPEGRAARLVQVLKEVRSGFLLSSRGGYGIARVCKACKWPAACARCEGILEQRKGAVTCSVCGAPGECANCGENVFGVQRGGAERVAEWAERLSPVPVRESEGPPNGAEVTVGTPTSVPDAGPRAIDLVGILDADRMLTRPGLSGPEQVLSTWFEAAAWARPRPHGRVIVETTHPGYPAIQSLVRGNPELFNERDAARRTEAGFPPGHPVFRIACTPKVAGSIARMRPRPTNLLVSELGDERVCLVTVSPEALDELVAAVREWARTGEVRRVEAEPHL
ncbi:MAG: hypothetical protein LC722_03115 [Actinobacteria bacterium]|nr:hypothetical protein [Actinomycetota bacterium]